MDAAELVTKPLETIVKGIDGVEHVYSQTEDDHVIVTARFFVGTDADTAILRVHEKIRANMDRIPLGIPEPLIVGRGINDVAVVVLTLSPQAGQARRRGNAGTTTRSSTSRRSCSTSSRRCRISACPISSAGGRIRSASSRTPSGWPSTA